MKFFSFLLAILSLHFLPGLSQYLSNPSFEGSPGIAVVPPDWTSFSPTSTPDTEPLVCDDFSPSHGSTYITLVARGPASMYPNTVENCQTRLLEPLLKDYCYSLSFDLASRSDLGYFDWQSGFQYYDSSVKLSVYGSNNALNKGNLLAEAEPVSKDGWESFSFSLKPETDISFLLLEVEFTGIDPDFGNILIDNMAITSSMPSIVMLDETYMTSDLPIQLEASEGISYSWYPPNGLSCFDCRDPFVNSNMSRTYTCTLLSEETGCQIMEIFILNFLDGISDTLDPEIMHDLFIPNVFTPNNDGANDFFIIPGLPAYSALLVFDRSGKEVYRSEEYQNNWDGTDKFNDPLPEDSYWYILITPGLSRNHKGHVYIKRD
jgi:gliding motility-associated-like protein